MDKRYKYYSTSAESLLTTKDQAERPGLFAIGDYVTFPPSGTAQRDLLRYLRLLGNNDRHDQIDYGNPAKAGEKCQHSQQADDGRINAEVFA